MTRIQVCILILLFFMAPSVSVADDATPMHVLRVRFDLEKNRLFGRSQITLPPGKAWTIHVGRLSVTSVSADSGSSTFQKSGEAITVTAGNTSNVLTIVYEAEYAPTGRSGRDDGIEQANIVGMDGIALVNSWYPSLEGPALFRVSASLPEGFEAVSEAEEIKVKELPDRTREFSFIFDHPVDSINLIAGRYIVERARHGNIDIITYFFPEDRELSRRYLEYTMKYLDMYENLLGPFPFKRFSVVENILPTGYSMPTYTLLGRDVVRLPFIAETSLGHEILHQWFGNSVYIDYKSGNWAEGLTTYLADHHYEELQGKGWEYRKHILTAYQSYITHDNDFSLKDFFSRTDRATASVGYGKTAMVFHALKELLGPDLFFGSLRGFYKGNIFRTASWSDLQKAFEAASGKELDWFFKQWVEDKGVLDFDISDIMVKYEGSKARIMFEIRRKSGPARFMIPVTLRTDKGDIRRTFEVTKDNASFEMETQDMPVDLVFDDNYDLFRKVTDDEAAPVVTMLLGGGKRIYVIPAGKEQNDKALSAFLVDNGFVERKEEDLKHEDIKNSSLIIPADSVLAKRLFASVSMPEGDFSVVMKFNPYSRANVIALTAGASPEATGKHLRRITHYGKYGTLVFRDGRNIVKSTGTAERGILVTLEDEVQGVEVPHITTAAQIIGKVAGKEIVYVGEMHDRFSHHRVQLQVIRELYKKNKKLAIGMEMFQKPYQNTLDDYIAGKIDEKTFLRNSEYFKQWAFDYNLYREILLFARENSIPVIALNIKREVVSRVSKGGLLALDPEDLKEVPSEIDLSDEEYRQRLRGYFHRHTGPDNRNFDFFFQAQVLWDEAMARNLNEYMEKNPGRQVVVLAGSGHMAFGSGIPRRAHRLNNKEYAVILNSDDVRKDIADFVLFPEPVAYNESPKLMAMLKEDNRTVEITGFAPDSIAGKAGLSEGDVIISLDGEKIAAIEDIKIHLLYKKKGDAVVVKVSRKRFLLGDKEMEVRVEF